MAAASTGDHPPIPYRGQDRRRVAGPIEPPFGRPYWVAAGIVLCAWALLTFMIDVSAVWVLPARAAVSMLQVASFMVAIGIAAVAISRWYLTSDAPALWLGVAFVVYGTVRLGLAELAPLIVPADDVAVWMVWLRPASQVVLIVMLARALTIVPVSSRISAPRLALFAGAALAATAFVLQFVPAVATAIDGAQAELPRSYAAVNMIGLTPIAFIVLGAFFTFLGFHRQRWLFAWVGLALLTVALGDFTRVFAPPPVESGLLGKELLRLTGMVIGLSGGVREILYTYRDSSTRLAHSEYTAMTAQERIREGRAVAEERAHEARSALAAIEGATRTLEHYRDRLPGETQAALSTAISGEIRRLQRLVSVEQESRDRGPFSLSESVAPLVATERARGVEVVVDVPEDLVVAGNASATEQVLQTLFDNARRYAPHTPVTVRAGSEGDWVVLRIEDRGPGVPEDLREAIFERGVRGNPAASAEGKGLGLYVAYGLMQEQGGELWVDERVGGGASFAVALPSPAAAQRSQEAVQRFEQGGEVVQDGGFSAARRGH